MATSWAPSADEKIDRLSARVAALERRGLGLMSQPPADPNQFVLPASVGRELLKAGLIGTTELADDSVTAPKIAANAVGSSEIATDAVGSDEIAALAVNTAELAGSAVTSGKIADGTIATVDVADNAIDEEKLKGSVNNSLGISEASTVRRDQVAVNTAENTTSTTFVDLTTVGPSITVTLPTSPLIMIWCMAEMKGNGGASAYVDVQEDGVSLTGTLQVLLTASAAYELNYTAPNSGSGTNVRGFSSFMTFGNTTSGSHTYKMVYRRQAGTSADFKNRRMWVIAIGP